MYPQNNYNASSLTPELLANGSDADSWPDSLTYQFEVFSSGGTLVACSTPSSDNGCKQTGSGIGNGWISKPDWTVPEGDLKWGQVYTWVVQDYDGLDTGTSNVQYIITNVPQPTVTSSSQNDGSQGISPGSSSYTTSVTDAQVSGVGPSLSIERDYDSDDTSTDNAFGAGWSSILDMVVAPGLADSQGTTDTVNVTYPDGQQVGFGKNSGGTFVAPQGRYATLAATTSPAGYTLTDKNDTVYAFTKSLGGGAYGISSITDALGNTLTFSWNSASPPQITSMTSASGRSLAITWVTPSGAADPHVQTVTTNDVTAGNSASALTWSYAYAGDDLAGVCSPASTVSCAGATACPNGSACTAYSYTPGNAYPDVMLNSSPDSYWRLDEASGGTAASSVLANEGSDNGTYKNVTLGQAGPLPGSTATAASFDGSSSYVKLPSNLVKTGSYQSVSLWFKTTTGGGVIFGTSQDQITTADGTGSYTPSLYLGTGGDLHGEFWNGTAAPIMTSEPVDDGSWHLAVLTGAGNTQTLYVDGQVVGTLSGAIDNENLTYGYVGTGFLGGNWPNQPNDTREPSYYAGDVSDVGFWDRPLTSAEVTAMYQAGHAGTGQLTTITRPSGSIYSQVSYSAVTGAVSRVTDDNGGTWQIAAPTVSGSSQVYVSSVLGQDPADYWRLNDTGTTDAVNQVNGGDASYNEVQQGVTGPFSDSAADSFTGSDGNSSGSYLTLPSGLVAGAGDQSVSLWFQTTAAGGVLLSSSADPIDNGTTAGNYTPELYIGGGGDLNAEFWNGTANPILTSSPVNDGKWHNVVLTAGTGSQSLYLDGKLVASQSGTIAGDGQSNVYLGTGFIGDSWPHEPNSGATAVPDYFTGSMGEVAFYNSQLTAAQVTAEYNASTASGGKSPVETVSLTDPGGNQVSYQLDPLNGNRIIAQTDGLGNTTQYGYDTSGFEDSVTDPDGNTTIIGHDIRGNVVSQTTCQDKSAGDCSTEYDTYYPDDTSSTLSPDPRNDLQLTSRGDGSASATDNTYLTSNAYNSAGELTSQTGPPVAGFPNGRTTTYTYSTASTSAYNASGQVSGATPPGLPLTETTPGGAVTTMKYYSTGDVYQVTDPDGLITTYTYDGLGRQLSKKVVSDSYPAGLTTTYAYDAMGDVVTETDPPVTNAVTGAIHTARITTAYDADGDLISQQVADTTGGDASRTVSRTYNSHDQVKTSTDSANATTSYTYDAYGNLASETDPAGNVTDYTYDPDGDLLTTTLENYTGSPSGSQTAGPLLESQRSYDPAGRLAAVTDAMNFTTAYTYTDNGLLATETRCSQWTGTACAGSTYAEQVNTYNGAGQLVTQVTNNGKTTTEDTPDAAGRNTSVTVDPAGLDRTTTYTYTPDDAVSSQTLTGPSGSVAQSTSYTYDAMGNMTSQSQYVQGGQNPDGWWQLNQASGTAVPDASGTGNNGTATSVTWASGAGTFNGTSSQVATSGPVLNTTGSFSVSAWVNPSSLVASEAAVSQDATQNSAFQLQYDSTTSGWDFGRKNADVAGASAIRAASSSDASTGAWQYLTGTYDASTGLMTMYVNGTAQGTATDTTPYAANGPLLIGRGQYETTPTDYFDGSISDVQVYQRTLTGAQVSALYTQGRNGGASTSNKLTTSWTLDQRGLPTKMEDPNGNFTYYRYDEAGQLAVTTSPTISTQVYGQQAVQTAPVTTTGYDTFGDPAESEDASGSETITAYDGDGRAVSVTQPSYTPPDGSGTIAAAQTVTAYNGLGQITSQTDPLQNKTTYAYDQLGDLTSQTAPDDGVTYYTYDTNGDQLSQKSPTGAVTDATYDFLGRQITSTQVERYPSPGSYTTQTCYNSNPAAACNSDSSSPWPVSQITPGQVTTSQAYDAAGEVTSVTDGAGNTTAQAYDAAGRPTKTTNPDGTYSVTSYDEAGRQTGEADYSQSGTELRSDSATYDADGNQLSATDYRGNTTTFGYDAADELTSETQPVTSSSGITTSFAYDPDGNPTLYTDGNGSNWWTTWNSWNLQESEIEPATTAAPTAADGTFTTSYDADGNPVTQTQPGGVSVTSSYNNMNELTGQAGSGADATTADRSFGYDGDGNLTSASAPGGSDTFSYDDRGLVTSAAGPSGTSGFTYNNDGLVASVADAAGTTSYTYDNADRLHTLADPATGDTLTYTYNQNSQVHQISYGSGQDTRAFGYNDLQELTSDTLTTSGGQQVASISYAYDPNGNLTSKDTAGFGAPASNTYTYDEANRLASWNNGTTTVSYGYDSDGNRTKAGSTTYAYDARDELTSDGTSSYSYTDRGTLAAVSGPGGNLSYTSDAFGQAITQGTQTYSYDALGRVVSDSGAGVTSAFSYDGTSSTIASDGSSTYTWDPTGTTLIGIGVAGGTQSGGVLALTDAHTDVTGNFTAGATTLSASAVYDPLGNVLSSTGMSGHLGYQSGWTDPATGRVDMSARWYDPAAGGFTSRDTADVSPAPNSAAANPFAYAADNPMTGTDPTGHLPMIAPGGAGGSGYAPVSHSGGSYDYTPPPAPRPPAPTCSGFFGCLAHDVTTAATDVYHVADKAYHVAAAVITGAAVDIAADAERVKQFLEEKVHEAVQVAGHVAHDMKTGVEDAASSGIHALGEGWHAVQSATSGAAHAVTKWATQGYHAAVRVIHTAAHDVARAATATASYVKHHAATIASVVASAAVFVGCDAALGLATGGVGAVAGAPECGALAGAVGSAVSYGITAHQNHSFSWTGLAEAAGMGAAVGGITGGLAEVGSSVLGGVASSLLAGGAADDAATAAADAAAQGAAGDSAAGAADTADAAAADPKAAETEPGGSEAEQQAALCGGKSFTASTKVVTASGALAAVSKLSKGQKVLAMDTRTGKTTRRRIAAVLVHHDTDLYDLRVKVGHKIATIDTTSNHLFWEPDSTRWVKAESLKHGTRLHTLDGRKAIVLSGHTPRRHHGWMWDLTVQQDHDFYVGAGSTEILVHNCSVSDTRIISSSQSGEQNLASINARPSGTGFNAIYDPADGSFEARLSEGEDALVARNGGHRIINRESFGGSDGTVAFTIITRGDEGLGLTWKSTSVNAYHFGQLEAPEEYREAIRIAVNTATGLTVGG